MWSNGALPKFDLVMLLRLNAPSVAEVTSMKELFSLHSILGTEGKDNSQRS